MTYIEGILPKGPYLPCICMAGRALLAGYHRHVFHSTGPSLVQLLFLKQYQLIWQQTSLKFDRKYNKCHSWKTIWKCCLQIITHFLFRPQCVMQSGRLFTSKRRWQQNDLITRQWKFQCWWDNPEYKPWTDQGLFSIYGFRSCDQMVSANERRAYILQVSGHVRMVSVNDRWRYICKFQVTWEWSQPMIEDVTYATQFLK